MVLLAGLFFILKTLMEQEYMKIAEVAAKFGVAKQTVRNWINKGCLESVSIDGTQFVSVRSLEKVESTLKDIGALEALVEAYKETLDNVEKKYKQSIMELRDCCEGNRALVKSKVTMANLLPTFINLIQPDKNTRAVQIIQMLLKGDDIRTIAERYELTTERIRQILKNEFSRIEQNCKDYLSLKKERDGLLEEVRELRTAKTAYEKLVVKSRTLTSVEPGVLTKNLADFDLSVRALNCCRHAGIETVGDLVGWEKSDIMRIRCMGHKTASELYDLVENIGLKFEKQYVALPDGTVTEATLPTT